MTDTTGSAVLSEYRRILEQYRKLGEGALAQLNDEDMRFAPDAESLGIALIVKHIAGNMRSRFTDFLTSDGEKPDRNRDSEFEASGAETKQTVMSWWDEGWAHVFGTIEELTPADLQRTVSIRGQEMSALEALSRATAHYAYHIGQIVYVAKMRRGADWQTLSIPKRGTAKPGEPLKFG